MHQMTLVLATSGFDPVYVLDMSRRRAAFDATKTLLAQCHPYEATDAQKDRLEGSGQRRGSALVLSFPEKICATGSRYTQALIANAARQALGGTTCRTLALVPWDALTAAGCAVYNDHHGLRGLSHDALVGCVDRLQMRARTKSAAHCPYWAGVPVGQAQGLIAWARAYLWPMEVPSIIDHDVDEAARRLALDSRCAYGGSLHDLLPADGDGTLLVWEKSRRPEVLRYEGYVDPNGQCAQGNVVYEMYNQGDYPPSKSTSAATPAHLMPGNHPSWDQIAAALRLRGCFVRLEVNRPLGGANWVLHTARPWSGP